MDPTRLESIEVEILPTSQMEPLKLASACPRLARCCTMHSLAMSDSLSNDGFYDPFLTNIVSLKIVSK